jgi:DNA-binding winged helix-turn-helix (wHTH) protein
MPTVDLTLTLEDLDATCVDISLHARWQASPSAALMRETTDVAEIIRHLIGQAFPAAQAIVDGPLHLISTPARANGAHPARVRLTCQAPDPPAAAPAQRGGLCIDRDARRVFADGREVHLRRREFELLAFLAAHPRQVFSPGQLLTQAWQLTSFAGTKTVGVHICRLRAALGNQSRSIHTVRGHGYRFAAAGCQPLFTDQLDEAADPWLLSWATTVGSREPGKV